MKHSYIICCIAIINLLPVSQVKAQQKPLLVTKEYSLYSDSVVQGNFTAKVLSATSIISNYKSPANQFKSPEIIFKFSINGKDNEMVSGTDHHFICSGQNGNYTTPVISFGKQLKASTNKTDNTYLATNTSLTIRVDLNEVFTAFNQQGYYTTFNGNKLYKEDFKGVYVAGNTAPLIWDFDNLVNHPQLQLKDNTGQHIYETTLLLNTSADEKQTEAQWQLTKNTSAFPQYSSTFPIADALYNLSLEEMTKAIEPDSTFRTGKEWAGVWTRDVSYSIILAMAHLQPRVAINSLLRKVNKKNCIIQDTGTGGAYPCSTDRMIWAAAAWEIYTATGDEDWLKQAYLIIKNSIEDDEQIAYDAFTGLVKGESSFLDWREQTYPKWMQPADIFESECLGTNAVHYRANMVLAQMASIVNELAVATKHYAIAANIKKAINTYLWMPEKGYYAQYLYGRNHKIISPRSEALGEALCVLWDIASPTQQQQIIANTPVTNFGIPCIYPQIPGIPPYHNNAVWPFVQTYWMWAAAKAGNETAVLKSIGDIYRPAAMFLTNKENFVASNGDFSGTQINSSNMLWSLSGNISLVQKLLFGIRFNTNGITFQPFVPKVFDGKRTLTNFTYRSAVLNIEMNGFGNIIQRITVDGKPQSTPILPGNITGEHSIVIQLANKMITPKKLNNVPVVFTPATPNVTINNSNLQWQPIANAVLYQIIQNGKTILQTTKTQFAPQKSKTAYYQVIAIDKNNMASFASEPLAMYADAVTTIYQAEEFAPAANYNYKGFNGTGFIEINNTINPNINIPVMVAKSAWYTIDFRYANGNGPTNTENKCAIRTVLLDGANKAAVVFPQRGTNEWSNWGYSNAVKLYLTAGSHQIGLHFTEANDNMNLAINQAMIDAMRMIALP